MMKNVFYFILKALFVIKFLSWLFGHVEKTAGLGVAHMRKVIPPRWKNNSNEMTEISVRRGNIFSYERIFLAKWDNYFLWSRCKKVLRNHSIYCNNNSVTILYIKNLKQLSFALILINKTEKFYVVFEYIVVVELPSNIKWESNPDMFKYNKTEPFFFKFMSPILNIGFSQNFPT